MTMRTAADHPDFAPFVSTSIDRLDTVKRTFADPMPVHVRERLFRILASSLKNVWKTVSLRPDEVHLHGDRILQRFTHEFGTTIDGPHSTPKGIIYLSRHQMWSPGTSHNVFRSLQRSPQCLHRQQPRAY